MPDYPFFLPRKAALPNLENGPKIVVKKSLYTLQRGNQRGNQEGGGEGPGQTRPMVKSIVPEIIVPDCKNHTFGVLKFLAMLTLSAGKTLSLRIQKISPT